MAIATLNVAFNGFKRLAETNTKLGVYAGNSRGESNLRLAFGYAALTQEGADPSALLFGLGNSTTRVRYATATHKFSSFYTEGRAASGSSEGLYWRHYQSVAGTVTAQAGRIFTTVQDVEISNARGAHISLSFGTSGTITGLGAAMDATLHIPNSATQAGTLCAISADINSDGSTSDPAGATTLAVFRVANQGNATGMADVDDDAVLFDFTGWGVATGDMLYDNTGTDPTNSNGSIKIKLPSGALAYLMYYDQQAA